MCNYCGCRSIRCIGDLTAEHETIRDLIGDVRRHAEAGDAEGALTSLRALSGVLTVHDAIEEGSIYPALAKREHLAEQVDILFDEHDRVDAMVAATFATADHSGAAAVDWPPVLDVLWTLSEHIEHEENGMFPAAAIELTIDEFEHAEAVRRRLQPPV